MFLTPSQSITGSAIRYDEAGQGEQTILFLHGLFGRPDNWKRVMEELSDFYRLIALQLPIDHAPDRRKAGIRSITELTDYVERALDHLGIRQAILCAIRWVA